MGFRPKQNEYYRHKLLSPEMKQAVRKMQRYSNQITLVSREKLKTIEEVKDYIVGTKKNMEGVTSIRQKYRNKLRNCKDEKTINEYKSKIFDCTDVLKIYRKNIKIANQIIEDVPEIKEKIKIEKQMRKEELSPTKTKNRYREER